MKRAQLFLTLGLLLSAGCFLPSAFAATAAPVAVSTIAVAGSTVTVTTAANHNLAVTQGFCLSAPGPACSAIATVPNATSFTFTQPSNVTVAACAAACGTVVPAPRVIVLETFQGAQNQIGVHRLYWLTTTAPVPGSGSVWTAKAGSAGASTAQSSAVAAGNFIEVNVSDSFPASLTTAQIQTAMQNDYNTRQANLAAISQPAAYFGSIWDGSGWGAQ